MPEQRYIVMPVAVSSSITSARTERLPRETGGFLIGHRRGDHLEIVSCTHQAAGDVATPTSFTRLSHKHAEEIEEAWNVSDGRQSIVGDWHSHPFGSALPSDTDKRAWKVLAKAMKEPGIGIIASDGEARVFYFMFRWGQLKVGECVLVETNESDAVYAIS